MAFYSLIAFDSKTEKWRTCAILPSGDEGQAIIQAKSLRESNSLGFLPYPTRFRLRRSSRREVQLLQNFLNQTDNSTLPTFHRDYLDNLMNRRRRLMNSFFLGLFLQPEVMKRRWGNSDTDAPAQPPAGSTSDGGVENENAELEELEQPEADTQVEDTQSSSEAEAAVGSDNLEAGLAALESAVSSADSGNSGEIDLDFV